MSNEERRMKKGIQTRLSVSTFYILFNPTTHHSPLTTNPHTDPPPGP
jgi:hypothetical protein